MNTETPPKIQIVVHLAIQGCRSEGPYVDCVSYCTAVITIVVNYTLPSFGSLQYDLTFPGCEHDVIL